MMPAWRTFTIAAIAVTFARATGAVDPRDGSGSADPPAAAVRPAWNFSWATLPVWASGQGVTDFSEEDARHLARFGVVWTQGMRWNPPPKFSGDYVPFSPPRAGYETWESAIISDAKKLRAIKPSLPVLGYYGYGGCCTGRNEWWLENYTNPANSALWLRDDTGHVVFTGDSPPLFKPVWDLCNPSTVSFVNHVILRDFVQSDDMAGSFFDSVTSYTGLGRFGAMSGYRNASFSAASRVRLDRCWRDAMVNISAYLSSKGKFAIMSTTSLLRHEEGSWDATDFEMLSTVGGFRYIEALCPRSWKVYGNESTVQTCVDQILTLRRDTQAGIPLMIRADSTNLTSADQAFFDFTVAVFLMVAGEHSYFAGGLHGKDAWCGPLCFPWFPAYDRPLGAPLGPAVSMDNITFSRRFAELGEVTVNVTDFSSCFAGVCSTAGTAAPPPPPHGPPPPPHPPPPAPPGPPIPGCMVCDGAKADAVVVSGAGTAGCNGVYKKTKPPPHGPALYFEKDAQHQMYAFQGQWRIGVMSQMLDYTSDLISPEGPPTSNWSIATGKAPAPHLQCQPASSKVPCHAAPPSPAPGPHPHPGIDLSTAPLVGDAVKMSSCSSEPAYGALRQMWASCTGPTCWPPGSPDATHRTNIFNNASGSAFATGSGSGVGSTGRLCLDSLGGAPGWSVRVWWCQTSNFNASAPWNPGGKFNPNTNLVTSSTWRLESDGTIRTTISRVGSPTNASGEVCLFSGLPSHHQDFTAGGAVMWWCDGNSLSKWNLTSDGRLVQGTHCLTAWPKSTSGSGGALPACDAKSPIPPPQVSCHNCSAGPCASMPFCNRSLSAQARAEDMVSRMSNQEKGYTLTDHMGVTRLTDVRLMHIDGLHGIDGLGCWDKDNNVCWDRTNTAECANRLWDSKCVEKPGYVPGGRLPTNYPNLTECRCATSFPSLVGVGASFNRSVFSSVGRVLSDEARAMFNMKVKESGLFFWTPDINLARNVLWGRNQETPGEDPLLSGIVGQLYTATGQGNVKALNWSAAPDGGPPLKTAWSIKHYLAYDVECSSGGAGAHFALTNIDNTRAGAGKGFDCQAPGVDRFHMNANISEPDLVDYYGEVFRRPLAAGVSAIMCAFPSINGTPACANGLLQNSLARDTYGFDGFITTDCGALPFTNQDHYDTSTPAEAVAKAIKNGLDAECGEGGPQGPSSYINWGTIHESLEKGLMNETDLDQAAIRIWRTAFKMGLFEPENPWSDLGWETLDSEANQEASFQAAAQSLTLLQNKESLLPLNLESIKTLAVMGPYTWSTQNIKGDYTGPNIRVELNSVGIRLEQRAAASPSTKLIYPAGTSNMNGPDSMCNWACVAPYLCACGRKANHSAYLADAVQTANRADVVLLTIGDTHVGEFGDRTDNSLEAPQQELLEAVCATGKPTVVVVIAGYSIDLAFAKENCTAILFAFLPSQSGGAAIVDTLLGLQAPAGRLPVTFYSRDILTERPDPLDVSLRGGSGITYLHYKGTPLWEFGFGLSYSSFKFEWSGDKMMEQRRQQVTAADVATGAVALEYTVKVTNTGSVASAVSVLAFLNTTLEEGQRAAVPTPPLRQLFNFTKVHLQPGSFTIVTLGMEKELLALTSWSGERAVRPGQYTVAVGGVGRAGKVEDGAVATSLEVAGDEPAVLFSMVDVRAAAAAREYVG